MKHKLSLTAAFWLAILISFSSPGSAQPIKLNVGYSAISGDQLPAWVAKEAGIFQKNGLDVQLIFFTGGTTAVMALVSADTPISQVAGSAVVNSVLAGSDSVMIAAGVTSLNYYWAKAANPEDYADSSFIKELDQSGYIDSLYKRK